MAAASDFGREDEATRITRYKTLVGEGPVMGKWRNRRGDFLATRFPDGQIEHVDVFDGKEMKETRLYGADGLPEATVNWVDQRVTVHFAPPVEVPVATWAEVELVGLVLKFPPELTAGPENRWTAPGMVVALEPAADPFSESFGQDLLVSCDCEIEARRTVWLGGRAAAHFRLFQRQQTADLIALPDAAGLLVLTASGKEASDLAPLRAIVATARRKP